MHLMNKLNLASVYGEAFMESNADIDEISPLNLEGNGHMMYYRYTFSEQDFILHKPSLPCYEDEYAST